MYKNKIAKLQLWSLNTYGGNISNYLRVQQGFVVVFDVTNHKTFRNVKGYLQYIEYYNSHFRIIILGTKSDCVKKRCVEREEVEALIADFTDSQNNFTDSKIKYFETSAKNPHVSTNISTIIQNLIGDIITENLVAGTISNYEIRDYQTPLEIPDRCCVVS